MLWHRVLQSQSAEPAIGQIQVYFLTQPPLRANSIAVSDNQHPDHQLRTYGGATRMAVVVRQVSTQLAKVKHPINSPEEVISGDVIFEMKGMEQLVLHHLMS